MRTLLLAIMLAGCATGPIVLHQGDSFNTETGQVYRAHWDGQDTATVFALGLAVEAAYIVGGRQGAGR